MGRSRRPRLQAHVRTAANAPRVAVVHAAAIVPCKVHAFDVRRARHTAAAAAAIATRSAFL